jgi:hypothetical protein
LRKRSVASCFELPKISSTVIIERVDETPIELVVGYEEALQSVCKFPNLTGVGMHFSNACSIEDPARWYVGEAAESFGFCSEVLKALFEGLNNPVYPTPNVRSLSINNLQNVNDPKITESDNFRSVLSRITDLRLKIINEWESAPPES